MMTDVSIKTNKKDFPVENSATRAETPAVGSDAPSDPVDELAARFIMDLPVEDFKSLKIQKTFVEEAVASATEAQAESFKRQVVAKMLQTAYDAAWRAVQQKHDLPDLLDVDWANGSVYRKEDNN